MQQLARNLKREPTAFTIYLRTGRRVTGRQIEVKFNPWHDPANGRFTFAGRGSFYPDGKGSETSAIDPQSSPSKDRQDRANYSDPNYTDAQASAQRNDPKNPQNYSIYVVRPGDNLSRIARYRKGLTAEDLAWLNEVPLDRPLQIGQRIKVPHQQSLDAGREAKNKAFALDYYVRTHRRQLPPDPKNPPSLESQILDSNWKREARNGYEFYIDAIGRSRQAYGLLHFGPSERSRKNQKGVRDREPRDDGGHTSLRASKGRATLSTISPRTLISTVAGIARSRTNGLTRCVRATRYSSILFRTIKGCPSDRTGLP